MVTPLLFTPIIMPLTYVLKTAKLDARGHRWIAKLAKFNFMIYYPPEKSNVEANALYRIPWDQSNRTEAVEAIFKATMEGPNALDGNLCLS